MNNLEIDVTYFAGSFPGSTWFALTLRGDDGPAWVTDTTPTPNGILPYNGYVARFRTDSTNDSVVRRVVNGASTDIVSGFDANIKGTNQECRVRFQVNGTNIRVKEWVTSSAEPSTWREATDSTFSAAGTTRIGVASGSDAGTYEWFIRDLKVINLDNSETVFQSNFSGSNGDPWPESQFSDDATRLDGVMDQQSGEGRISLAAGRWGRAVAIVEEVGLAAPSGFTFSASGRTLEGSWSAVAEADSYDWEVQRDDDGVWVAFESGNTATLSFQLDETDLVAFDTSYRSRVRSDDAGTKSSWTGYAEADTAADELALTGVQIAAVSLSWTAATGPYDIRRDSTTLIAEGLTVTTFVDTDVTVGTSYTYEVREDAGAWSAPITVTVVADGGGVFFLKPSGSGWTT